ncbi:hypothetical protein [Kitasatospora sp. McL0602]|uniref:hypothetical protein n=1 Tax=Kitasatospora sp. McL0602 TaxID=3439530 RepID=UPI003F88EF2D
MPITTRTAVSTPRRWAVVAAAALTAAALTGVDTAASASTPAPAAAPAAAPTPASAAQKVASVVGSARIFYAYSPNDDIHFTVDAHAVPFSQPLPQMPSLPTDARGTIKISHWVAAKNETATAEGTVDCLVTGDKTATLTAVITSASPQVQDWIGKRVGISVLDSHGQDRLGFSWDIVNFDQDSHGQPVEAKVGTCMAPAPFAPVREGGFTVRPADLAPVPVR